ncbi:recombinase family protein, partial [Paracraurococcus lichenis]
YVLRNIEPDRASLSHGRLPWWSLNTSTLAHRCRRGASTPSHWVSSRSQARAQTIDQQIDRLRAHAAAQSWNLAQEQIFRDDGYSGASLRRPGLDRLRDMAAGAQLDRILITAPDRLARNYVHQQQF